MRHQRRKPTLADLSALQPVKHDSTPTLHITLAMVPMLKMSMTARCPKCGGWRGFIEGAMSINDGCREIQKVMVPCPNAETPG